MSDRFLPGIHDTPRSPIPRRAWAWAFVVACVLGIGVFVAAMSGGTEEYDMNNELEAVSQCEARIEQQLKAPSTAEFNSSGTGNGTWTVTGTVDAENGFGAKIRSSYQCTVIMNNEAGTARTRIDYFE